ncbi:hypothetical protein Bca52824_040766 [Brassica carinata]|uniref:Uncharacterized protein n=1 Tax=Brassica carinata TaxID=52824 RepID=A0A8X7RU44_BRACI|nr:hypothetical protein Bca52824_040766 [Brassica carinata]
MSKTPDKQELPLETSPYTKYEDIEDYKKNHGQGGGTTDAPTLSGSAPPSAIDSANQEVNHTQLLQNKTNMFLLLLFYLLSNVIYLMPCEN